MSERAATTAPKVTRLVRAAARRERIADAAALLTRVALPLGCAIAAVAVVADRRLDAPAWLAWLGLAPAVVVLVWAAVRRARPRRVARRIDAHYGLHDLIGNALEFAGSPATSDPEAADLMALHVADAEAAAPAIDPRPVVPLRPPGLRAHDLAAVALLALATLVPRPPPPELEDDVPPDMPPETAQAATKKPPADRVLAEPLREDLRALKEGEDRAAALAERMLQILDAYGRGELDREAAYAQLEELDKSLAEAEADLEARMEEDPAVLAEGVRQLSEALKQEEITQDAAEALARGDGDQAEKSLADAEAEAEASDEAERSLQRAMQQAEKALGKAAGENTDTASQLAEAERRLKRQQEQPAADPEEQERRLKKQQQKVEELRRQHEREKAAQRKLDELRRQANDAQKGQQGSQQKKRALEQLRRGAGDTARKASQSRRLGQARDDLEEAKSFMRRAGQGGEQDDKRKQQMQKFAKAAKGKRGDKKKARPCWSRATSATASRRCRWRATRAANRKTAATAATRKTAATRAATVRTARARTPPATARPRATAWARAWARPSATPPASRSSRRTCASTPSRARAPRRRRSSRPPARKASPRRPTATCTATTSRSPRARSTAKPCRPSSAAASSATSR
ncbi:hypothetical protein [Nannocystis pusilla]|uniref:hypothetical protein n=1 Tax=Nannocystis pusilla TaxID=889268 RepID=UPI003B776CD9